MDLAIVGVAVAMDLSPSRVCREARIVLGAVGPTPLRAQKAEATLKDTRITPSLIERSAELAMEEARPISDVRASARYRKEMIGILTSRVIKEVAGI